VGSPATLGSQKGVLSGKCGWLRREGPAHPPSGEFGTWLAQEGEGRGCFLVTTYERPEQKDLPVALIAYCPGARPMGAAHTENTYFAARFHRLAAKRGSKRAIVAIGHKILVLTHYLLQHHCPFRELGADYYLRLRAPASPNPLSVAGNALATRSRSHLLSRQSEYFRESLLVG
jgi:hypothetical protein